MTKTHVRPMSSTRVAYPCSARMLSMSVAATPASSYTPTRTASRPGGGTHSTTGAAPGSQEFGDASPIDGPPHAAVNHATPSSVRNGDSDPATSATAEEVEGGAIADSPVAQPASKAAAPTAVRAPTALRTHHVTDMHSFRAQGAPHSHFCATTAEPTQPTRISADPPESHRYTARYSGHAAGEPSCTPTQFRSPRPPTAPRSSCHTTPHPGSAATPC